MAWPSAEADLWRELVAALRLTRQRQGLTIAELEERLGVCRNHIEKWENGVHRPSAFLFFMWAWALGLRLELVPLDEAALDKGPPLDHPPARVRRRLPAAHPLAR